MTTPGDRLRVMIVDDHPLVRSAVARALEGDGIVVVAEVATGEEALALAPTLSPDILLLDVELPGMSGIQLVRELAPRLPATKIVMLTVSSADRDLADAMRNGASGYLTKDVSPEALVRAIRGAQDGELAMSRRLAARLLPHIWRRKLPDDGSADEPLENLTPRERDVLRLLSDGLSDRDIASAMTVSRRTVETHVSGILHKLGARNRVEAARRYREGR
jgi:DNA-binding NarL/FixJ family response regulator